MAIRPCAVGYRIDATEALKAAEKQDRFRPLHLPEWLIELRVRFHKEGSTKMRETIMTAPVRQLCAGIDTGKHWLDVALSDGHSLKRRKNDADGHQGLIAELEALGVARAGIEATGGYETQVCQTLRRAGLEVQVFQPAQVRAYARFKLERAKSDAIDARIIAQCTAELKELRMPPDPRLAAFAGHLTVIEQIEEDIARARIRREHAQGERALAHHKAEITRLTARRREELKRLEIDLRAHADLASRLELVVSIDGVGRRTGIAMIVRMPELGSLTREKAASLLGAAPFIRQSGRFEGERHVEGGRKRPRTSLFACAQAAIKWNPLLAAHYTRLRARGKHHAVAIMACTRKLVIYINAVLERATPWHANPLANT
jgi:transposase